MSFVLRQQCLLFEAAETQDTKQVQLTRVLTQTSRGVCVLWALKL